MEKMNKKGQILPIIAILSIFLVGYTYYVLVVLGHSPVDWEIGKHSTRWLIQKEVALKEIDFYYGQAFRNAVFKTVGEVAENGGGKRDLIWDENPYPKVKEVFKNTLEKNFKFYLDEMDFEDNEYYKGGYEIVLPKNFELSVEDGKINAVFNDELILRDYPLDYDYLSEEPSERTHEDSLISISKKLKYEYKFKNFKLSIFERIYGEFSKSNNCIESVNFRNIKCLEGISALTYEIPLEREGFVVPVVKFKIPKILGTEAHN